ncbi:hypothetical protein [Enterococcus faecium]|uniref:hypothetical protein n=1 Tax=Enterococcus faecium TaxID=1352 RepID=UPI0018E98811|nr:hypothetical protein [Enterococcus faecium]MCE3186541.1 hypothetical protein [Enterococcus faecium]MCU2174197.1 hypothetical protein [Enterococcus faecium]QQF27267.1 hypothetical protein JCQ06_04590 [Enterococcus faecium]HDG6643742.1 hypothetical protein [Enterococcus faecium]
MASSLYNLALDFSKELNYTKAIMARQGDKGITVTVKPFLNGLQMDTSGGTFTLKGTTPSNRYVDSVATSVTSEEVTFSLDGTFMSEAGYYKHCYVEYRKDNQILTTQDIIFFSLGVSDISQGQADEYVSQLEELIRKYNETFDAFMAEIKGRVDSLNKQITDLTGQAKTLQDKLDALKEEISKLGNLQVMYSNSIEFGDYDYSGNPNLMNNLSFSDFVVQSGAGTISDGGNFLKINKTSGTNLFVMAGYKNSAYYLTPVLPNTTYTITYVLRKSSNFVSQSGKRIFLRYRLNQNDVTNNLGELILDSTNVTAEFTTYTKTFTTGALVNPNRYYFQVLVEEGLSGEIELSYEIKLERGSTATPYQPNLLDDPYWLGKTPLGENIADPTVSFPIKTSAYRLYGVNMLEEFKVGQRYTITIKGTKPATQDFWVFNSGDVSLGKMKPVEGLSDIWTLTFTPNAVNSSTPKLLAIYQTPQSTAGACQIDWLKIEKGDTRTPNIEQYKYRGIGMRDSNNPKDYVWDLEPSYVENNLATDIKVAEITGKANNYTDGKVSEINSQLTASINEVDTTAKDAQTKANANETAIKSTNSRVNEIENIITALTKEETYLLPASIVSGGSLKFTSRGGMTVATGSFKLAKDIAFGEVLVNDLPDSMINIDNNAIGTGAVTGNSVSQIYVESNTRKVVANTAMKKDQWFTVGFSYHSKLSI